MPDFVPTDDPLLGIVMIIAELEKRVTDLQRQVMELDARTIGSVRIGPQQWTPDDEALRDRMIKSAGVPPVDRSQWALTDRVQGDHTDLKPDGQQQAYMVLTPEERAKCFVRPVRQTYVHRTCGTRTTMALEIAETYARDLKFYTGTFCVRCGKHLPSEEFIWDGTEEQVGS